MTKVQLFPMTPASQKGTDKNNFFDWHCWLFGIEKESQRGQPYYPQAEHHQQAFSFCRALKARLGVDLFGFDATIGPGTNQTLRTTHRGDVSQVPVIRHFFLKKDYIMSLKPKCLQIQKQIVLKF